MTKTKTKTETKPKTSPSIDLADPWDVYELRAFNQLKVGEVASLCGVTTKTWRNWESGKGGISIMLFELIKKLVTDYCKKKRKKEKQEKGRKN